MGINLVAALLIGLSINNVAKPNYFPMSGVSGIMLLLNYFFGTPLGVISLLVNIPIIAVCWRFLSRKFVLKSIATLPSGMMSYSLELSKVMYCIPLSSVSYLQLKT